MSLCRRECAQLSGRKCSVFDSNARIRVIASGNAFYPDASVVCARVEVDAEDQLSAINPTVLVEVLSPSTAEYDRTDKLAEYQRIPSIRHIVHVAHDTRRIDVWTREQDGFTLRSWSNGEQALLEAIECRISVEDVYRDPLA